MSHIGQSGPIYEKEQTSQMAPTNESAKKGV